MKNRKIRFVGTLTILLLFGFFATSFISYYVAHYAISSQVEKSTLPLTSDNIYSEIQQDLLRPIFISSLMAHDTFVRDWAIGGEEDDAAIIRYLKEIQIRYGAITSFFVSEKTKKYYHPTGVLKRISGTDPQDKWYYRVKAMSDDYEINVDTDTADRQSLTIFINYRVYDYAGHFIGATGVGLSVTAVRALINTYQQRFGRRIYFAGPTGQITLRGKNFAGPENIRRLSGLSQLADQILTRPQHSLTYRDQGKTVYLNSRWVPEFGWYLIVEQVGDPGQRRILNTLMANLVTSVIITLMVLFIANLTIGGYQRRIEKMATTDKLTGAASRQIFDMLFNQANKYSRRQGGNLSAIMFDIDRFKSVNDHYGHPTGDLVLKTVVQMAKSQIRASDIICRWGGEEFMVLTPDCDREQARQVAEKLRQAIADQVRVPSGSRTIAITASFGVGQLKDKETWDDLVKRIDTALYAAKANGRNRVELSDGS